MKTGRVIRFGVLALLLCSACGGADDEKPEAVQKCEDFAEVWCSRAMTCLVTVGTVSEADLASNEARCVDVAIDSVPCKNAVQVTSSYDACVSAVDAMDCSSWAVPLDQLSSVTPPAVCQGIILVSN